MPTFTPLGATVKLVTYDLATSTSAKLHKSKQHAASDLHCSEQAALSATSLVERHIPCLGDTTRLHFLDDVPFYLVEARTEAQDMSLEERVEAIMRQRREGDQLSRCDSNTQETGNDIQIPRALGLVITLPKEVFVESFQQPAKIIKGLPTYQRSCIKYDVFFNGDHAISDFQSSRCSHGSTGTTPTFENGNIRIVTGKRVNILFERPWVVVPIGYNADGTLRSAPTGRVNAERRWDAIGRALLQRANEHGFDQHNERSPLGKFLADLAAMEIPETMTRLQGKTGHCFGVIDVILTAGRGQKGALSHHYLHGPERLVEPNFRGRTFDWEESTQRTTASEQQPAVDQCAPNTDQILRSLAATAAFNRTKRTVVAPASYKDTGLRKSRSDTPFSTATPTPAQQPKTTESPVRTNILPAFPTVPEIDFNDAIAITPTKAEAARGIRRILEGSPTIEIDKGTGPTTRMRPPLTIPRSANKRRCSDTISLASDSTSPTRGGTVSMRPGGSPGSKSVSGYMGMTRRGIFSKSKNAKISSPASANGFSRPAITSNGNLFTVSRVIMSAGNTIVLDKKLTYPYVLRNDRFELSASQYQALDESIVFPHTDETLKPASRTKAAPLQNIHPARILRSNRVKERRQMLGAANLSPGGPLPAKTALSEVNDPGLNSNQNPLVATTPVITPSPFVNHPILLPPHTVTTPGAVDASATATPSPLKPTKNTPRLSSASAKGDTHDAILAEECAKWRLPDLCQDCVITYTADGPWLDTNGGGVKGGVMRHMKSARAGVFMEDEVVFAVRYIVAGR